MVKSCPAVNVRIPEKGYKHLLNPEILNASSRPILGERIFSNWGACKPVPERRARSVRPHEKVSLGEFELEYIPAPGHAPHHNVLRAQKQSIVFSADALGIFDPITNSIIPTTPPPSFKLDQALQDIQTVKDLNPDLVCLAHFGEVLPDPNFYENVKKTFVEWADIVWSYVKDHEQEKYENTDHEQIFAALIKKWPNYQALSEDLKEQVSRVDVGGLLNYYIRSRNSQCS